MSLEEGDGRLVATVTRILVWYDGPVLTELAAQATDGSADLMLAMALPDGEAGSHVVARPTRERMAAWRKKACDLRDLQLDVQTRHYLAREGDRFFGPGDRLELTPFAGAPPEAWMCHAGLFVEDVDRSENRNKMSKNLDVFLTEDQEIEMPPDLRRAFRAPDRITVKPFRGDGRPAWLREMSWDGTESVSCGDRFYLDPAQGGFTLVAYSHETFLPGYPVGYLSASLSEAGADRPEAYIEMVQVDADFRGERVGSALAAALAALILRDGGPEQDRSWEVGGDTQTPAAEALVRRLQEVLDEMSDADAQLEEEVRP